MNEKPSFKQIVIINLVNNIPIAMKLAGMGQDSQAMDYESENE